MWIKEQWKNVTNCSVCEVGVQVYTALFFNFFVCFNLIKWNLLEIAF